MSAELKINNVLIIGLGNVGSHLAIQLSSLSELNVDVYSRNQERLWEFSRQHKVKHLDDLSRLTIYDLVLICLNDSSIIPVVEKIPESIPVAYTSGALELKDLSRSNKGVFYPLQTFIKDQEISLARVPFFIEADHFLLESKLVDLAKRLSKNVQVANSEYRQKLHVAAVFTNNFTNFIISQAADFLKEQNIPFSHLLPLLEKTVENVKNQHPKTVQTGPARRGDTETQLKHVELLNDEQKTIYLFLSEQIKKYYD